MEEIDHRSEGDAVVSKSKYKLNAEKGDVVGFKGEESEHRGVRPHVGKIVNSAVVAIGLKRGVGGGV